MPSGTVAGWLLRIGRADLLALRPAAFKFAAAAVAVESTGLSRESV